MAGDQEWQAAICHRDEGSITVPARLLTDFVSNLPPEKVELELAVRTQTLHVRCSRFNANMKGIDAADFPIIPTTGTGVQQDDQEVVLEGTHIELVQSVVIARQHALQRREPSDSHRS